MGKPDVVREALAQLQHEVETESFGELSAPVSAAFDRLRSICTCTALTKPDAVREALRSTYEMLLQRAEHDQQCEIFNIDDEGRHFACSCGLDRVMKQARASLSEQPASIADQPSAHVLFRQDDDGLEPVMFYGPGTAPDPATLKDRFTLRDVWLSPPPARVALSQADIDRVVYASREAEECPTALVHRVIAEYERVNGIAPSRAQEPLSEEQIDAIAEDVDSSHFTTILEHWGVKLAFGRSIERAHGIGISQAQGKGDEA